MNESWSVRHHRALSRLMAAERAVKLSRQDAPLIRRIRRAQGWLWARIQRRA